MKPIERDLPYLEEIRGLITEIADSYDIRPDVVGGVISRESGGGRLLGKRGCPPGTGDRGHGRGLMQIDDRWHPAFLSIGDLWTHPAANIAYGCWLIRKNLDSVKKSMPGASDELALKTALAGYNCGLKRALKCAEKRMDIDHYTAGGDYSEDVLERASFLADRGWNN